MLTQKFFTNGPVYFSFRKMAYRLWDTGAIERYDNTNPNNWSLCHDVIIWLEVNYTAYYF